MPANASYATVIGTDLAKAGAQAEIPRLKATGAAVGVSQPL
jgi:hypothetical protein